MISLDLMKSSEVRIAGDHSNYLFTKRKVMYDIATNLTIHKKWTQRIQDRNSGHQHKVLKLRMSQVQNSRGCQKIQTMHYELSPH